MRVSSSIADLFVWRCRSGEGGGGLAVHHCQGVQLIKDAVPLLRRLLLCKAGDGGRSSRHNAPGLLHIVVQQPADTAANRCFGHVG